MYRAVIKSPMIFEMLVTVVNELPKSLSGISSETCNEKALKCIVLFRMGFYTFTLLLSKSGVSSVVVFIGCLVGDIEFIDPLDADPTPCADADDAWKMQE